jgi:nucleosome binding factor SPN SPT16 subunit
VRVLAPRELRAAHRARLIILRATAKHLEQLKNHNTVVPVELLVQAKSKAPPTDALPRFAEAFSAHHRIGTLTKEAPRGKVIDEWNKALDAAEKKPELIDVAPAISALLAVKDDEELVR